MTTTQPELRMRLEIDPVRVLAVLPAMGKLMVGSSRLGATHERIGVVEAVSAGDGLVMLGGAAHDCRVDTAHIARMIVDRSGRMGDKAFPRIDFHASEDTVLFSVVGFDGLEPFDAALAGFGAGIPVEPAAGPSPGGRGEVAANDPGAQPFEKALASGDETVIGLRRPGFEQRWRGRVETVKPAMGFINVMRPDFHLHLKAGSVARWTPHGDELLAETGDGSPLGLFVSTAGD